jgi:dienelactone hydrolase
MTDKLLEASCAVARVNNRGHDLMYTTARGRLGAAYETVDDCRLDLRSWVDFMASRGHERLAIWGLSLGALKTVYYLAMEDDSRVVAAIATSPPRFSYEAYSRKETAERFLAQYTEARARVDAGDTEALLSVEVPTKRVLAARTYIDKYGPNDRYDLLKLLPMVRVPLHLAVGSEEGLSPAGADWFPFGGLAKDLASVAAAQANVSFDLIAGANHAYSARHQELWTAVRSWLDRLPA